MFSEIRAAAARVASIARSVSIDGAKLSALAEALAGPARGPAKPDPAHHRLGSDSETLAYIVTLDAINFGSGWFPLLRKRPGCSGYFTIATCLEQYFAKRGPLRAEDLVRLGRDDCAVLFEQDLEHRDPAVGELMELFAHALRDLGALLSTRYEGDFGTLVAAAGGSAEQLAGLLVQMPFYRDVSHYDGMDVPFYKRAQLTAADLAAAFEGKGPGRFEDLSKLTIFADNLVPHVLRREGVLVLADELAGKIDAGQLLEQGVGEEVELRACAVHAVERMVGYLETHDTGTPVTAGRLDSLLWTRGQSKEMKAHPRPRARSVYY